MSEQGRSASTTPEQEAIVEELRAKHGEVAAWVVPGHGLVVAAVPENPKAYHQLINDLKRDKVDTAIALENFALACVCHPSREDARRIFRARPAFASVVAKRGQELCGGEIQELGKD